MEETKKYFVSVVFRPKPVSDGSFVDMIKIFTKNVGDPITQGYVTFEREDMAVWYKNLLDEGKTAVFQEMTEYMVSGQCYAMIYPYDHDRLTSLRAVTKNVRDQFISEQQPTIHSIVHCSNYFKGVDKFREMIDQYNILVNRNPALIVEWLSSTRLNEMSWDVSFFYINFFLIIGFKMFFNVIWNLFFL